MDMNSLSVFVSIVVVIAVFASLVARGVKAAVPEIYHDFVPLGLTVVLLPLCAGLAYLLGHGWQLGLAIGIISTAAAIYGWAFVVKTIQGIQSVRDAGAG